MSRYFIGINIVNTHITIIENTIIKNESLQVYPLAIIAPVNAYPIHVPIGDAISINAIQKVFTLAGMNASTNG